MKERNSFFAVWMLVWAFTVFRGSSALAQNTDAYTPGDYRTASAGSLSQTDGTSQLEQLSTEGTWVTAAYPLPTTATLFVEHPIQLSGLLQLTNLHIAAQKSLMVPAAASLMTTNKLTVAASAQLVQQGEIENRGLLQLQANSLLIIKSSAYKASSLVWAGTEEIDASSEVRIEAAFANELLFSGSQLAIQPHGYWFGKVTVAPTLPNSQWQLTDASAPLAAQTFSASLPATSSLLLLAGSGLSLQMGQDVSLSGGSYFLQNQSAGTGTVGIAGNLTLQNATLTLNQTASTAAVSTVELKGNLFTDAASVINNSSTVNTSTSGIQLAGNTWQILQVAGPVNHVSLTVKPGAMVRLGQHLRLNPSPYSSVHTGTLSVGKGATLDFGTDASGNGYQVQGQGNFKLEAEGTLYVTSAQGINAAGAIGNVQVTDSRRGFNQVATFVYNGRVPQQTGNALTTSTSGKVIIIDNPMSVTLTQATGISSSGRLEVRQGTFITTAAADITGGGKLLMTGGTYQIATLHATVPLLTGGLEISGGAVELTGAGNQTLRGGTYYNVIIGGSNEAGSTFKTISTTTTVTNNLTILPNAILDITNKSLKGDGGLTMTGGLFRTSRVSETLPELSGKNSPYKLTGGTIEFYGTINGQNQSIRGTYGSPSQKITYYHLLLTAAETNTQDEKGNQLIAASFDVAGALTVKAPAVLQIAYNRAVGGTGNFIVEPGATLLYGSPQGIKLSGTGTLDGNVRVSGTRSFSPQATYGFIGNSEMVTGDGLPATVANVRMAKTGGSVTLSKSVAVSEVFFFKSGIFKTDLHEVALTRQDAGALQLTDPALYIQGNLRRNIGNSGTYSFPVGNAAGKRQLDLVSIGLSGNGFESVAVGFKPLTHHQDADLFLTEGEHTYTHIEKEGVWTVAPNATPATGSFTAMASLQGFTNLSDNKFALLIRPLNSTSGKDWTTGGGTLEAPGKEGRTVAGGYAKRNFITPFGQLGIANSETVLPVSWLYVKAERKKQQVNVHWATASEVNNDRFEVEYSLDGKNFTFVGKVAGSGNSNIQQEYSFQHVSSATAITYYRVKQIDYDGKFEYSKVVAVQQTSGTTLTQITLYPNPSHDYLHLSNITLEASASVEILDLHGRNVGKVTPQGNGATLVIPVQQLPAGTYLLRIKNASQFIQQRFVKQ
ncbi:T9SS type A sorting domain-containing protein [Rufibacter sp. XAAS-G3-1]|uniref:T9SS type A sorting domain-containing protein n=1 Tax=Rufibacter sp. XAAS-G3-1 TaxID=2729134 RepID=UPI0015E794EA|nr:T9SS type A sorting domain-containing protein [Rufibacter sp. XAAS-G3-1]